MKKLVLFLLGLSFVFTGTMFSQTFEQGMKHYKKANINKVTGNTGGERTELEEAHKIFKFLADKKDNEPLLMCCLISLKLGKQFSLQDKLLLYVKKEYPDFAVMEIMIFYGNDKALLADKLREIARENKTTLPFFSSGRERGTSIYVKTKEGKEIKLYKAAYALVIGNGGYNKTDWAELPGALMDADAVANALSKRGYHVTLEKDIKTKEKFETVFAEFSSKYGQDSENQILFYYAGHGHTEKLRNDENLGYLVMTDAPEQKNDMVTFNRSSVDMQYFITEAKKIKAKHVLFIFDSCFSGTIVTMRAKVTPEYISDNVRYVVRQFITAGRENEKVPDRSLFRRTFFDLLEGRDKEPMPDGYITGEEMGFYLKHKVPGYNPEQHPQYGKISDPKLDKGDFVFLDSKDRFKKNKRTPAIPFYFPKRIRYKVLGKDTVIGECRYSCTNSKYEGMYSLNLSNFEFEGIEWLWKGRQTTYIFCKDFSIYGHFFFKGKVPVIEFRLGEGIGFDLKGHESLIYKDLKSPSNVRRELITGHKVISLPSAFFIASKRVAANKFETERFNLPGSTGTY